MTKIRKAAVAAAGTFAATLGVAMLDGALTGAESVAAAGTGLVIGFATWRVPNDRSARRGNRRA